jgi:hypothetical protein
MEALKKYGPKCMCRGETPKDGAVMNVDHIKPRKLFPDLALDHVTYKFFVMNATMAKAIGIKLTGDKNFAQNSNFMLECKHHAVVG